MRTTDHFTDNFDWVLLGAVLLLCGIGVVNLYSATRLSSPGLYLTQLLWLGVGCTAAAVAALFDYRIYERVAVPGYVLLCMLLVLVLFVGIKVYGSRRWLGFGGFTFQPSEYAKLAVIFVLAHYFHNDERLPRDGYSLWQLKGAFALLAVPIGLILREPDLGTSLMVLAVGAAMILFVRVRWTALLAVFGTTAVAVPVVWFFGLHDYQKQRILSFVNPAADALGAGYHARQSVIAVGSGGLWGKGFMKGTQTQLDFLPEQHTDFIFSVFAEEWGFVASLAVLALYFVVLYRAVVIASRAKERFGALLAVGIGALLFWHVLVNVGMVLGLMPVVGVTLPFLSYGGSSLVAFMIGIGFLLNISMRRYMF